MDDDAVEYAGTTKRPAAVRGFRTHLLAYVSVNGALFLIDLLTPGAWWFIWPMLGWGLAVVAHWLYVKCINVDDEWAEQRTQDIRLQAYDLSHIDDIKKRREAADSHRRVSSRSAPPSNRPS